MRFRPHHLLALLPAAGLFVGVPLMNRAEPRVFGWPPLMAWMVAWIVLTTAIMAVLYVLDRGRDDGA